MDTRIPQLPHWIINDMFPAVYDSESATAIEQTAKLYGAMQKMIEDYNKYADEINKTIEEFITGVNSDQECFENKITKIVHDYIDYLDSKIASQDKIINDSIVYIKENLKTAITNVIAEMKETGEIDDAILNSFNNLELRVSAIENCLSHSYDGTTETLNLSLYEVNTDANTLYVNNVTNYSIDEPNEQVNIEEEE